MCWLIVGDIKRKLCAQNEKLVNRQGEIKSVNPSSGGPGGTYLTFWNQAGYFQSLTVGFYSFRWPWTQRLREKNGRPGNSYTDLKFWNVEGNHSSSFCLTLISGGVRQGRTGSSNTQCGSDFLPPPSARPELRQEYYYEFKGSDRYSEFEARLGCKVKPSQRRKRSSLLFSSK